MSKFTTEVRYIVDTLGTGETIEEKIATAAPLIFSDIWTTSDADYKPTLEAKILRHYYMREIGAETYELWRFQINSTLSEITPKYNAIYKSMEAWQNNLLSNINVTESQELTNNQDTTANTSTSDSTQNSSESTGKNITSGTNSGTSNADAWQEYNDTPQGGLDGITSGKYLTNATRNRSENGSNTSTEGTSETTNTSTSTAATTSTGTSTGNAKTTENYVKMIIGKNSGTDFIDVFQKLVSAYNDIDSMIINDLNSCFLNLWE